MATPIQPYLGTGIAEMLADRRRQEFESSLRQQEATAPILAQTLQPFMQLALMQPGGMQNLQQMLGASGLRMPFASTQSSGTLGGLMQMLGAPQQEQAAGDLLEGAGVDPGLLRQSVVTKAFPGLQPSLTGQQERVNEALTNIAQTETVIPQIRQSFANLQTKLSQAGVDFGRAVSDFSGLAPGWLESAEGLSTRQELARLYNQLMQSPLSGMAKQPPLDPEALKRPDQMKSFLDSLLPQIEFQYVLSQIIRDAQNEAQAEGRMLTEYEIAQAKSKARQIADKYLATKKAAKPEAK